MKSIERKHGVKYSALLTGHGLLQGNYVGGHDIISTHSSQWDNARSALCGDYILAIGAKVLAQLHNEEVLIVLSQVLADLVHGKFYLKYMNWERFHE